MSCENEQRVIASLLDGREEFDGEGGAAGHVEKCGTCNAQYRSLLSLRKALRALNAPAMPDGLAERLRVLASHERQRLLLSVNLAARLRHWAERLQLCFDNMMRPLALPFAGGLLSALSTVVIFACIMQTQAFPNNGRSDVPTPLSPTDPDGEELYWAGQAPEFCRLPRSCRGTCRATQSWCCCGSIPKAVWRTTWWRRAKPPGK